MLLATSVSRRIDTGSDHSAVSLQLIWFRVYCKNGTPILKSGEWLLFVKKIYLARDLAPAVHVGEKSSVRAAEKVSFPITISAVILHGGAQSRQHLRRETLLCLTARTDDVRGLRSASPKITLTPTRRCDGGFPQRQSIPNVPRTGSEPHQQMTCNCRRGSLRVLWDSRNQCCNRLIGPFSQIRVNMSFS